MSNSQILDNLDSAGKFALKKKLTHVCSIDYRSVLALFGTAYAINNLFIQHKKSNQLHVI